MAATKSTAFKSFPSRRGVLALLGGLALVRPVAWEPAVAKSSRQDLVLHDGWVLRPDDLTRLGRS